MSKRLIDPKDRPDPYDIETEMISAADNFNLNKAEFARVAGWHRERVSRMFSLGDAVEIPAFSYANFNYTARIVCPPLYEVACGIVERYDLAYSPIEPEELNKSELMRDLLDLSKAIVLNRPDRQLQAQMLKVRNKLNRVMAGLPFEDVLDEREAELERPAMRQVK